MKCLSVWDAFSYPKCCNRVKIDDFMGSESFPMILVVTGKMSIWGQKPFLTPNRHFSGDHQNHGKTFRAHKIINFYPITALGVWKSISNTQTFHFYLKFFWFVCFPSIYAILSKKERFLAKTKEKWWGTDKIKKN